MYAPEFQTHLKDLYVYMFTHLKCGYECICTFLLLQTYRSLGPPRKHVWDHAAAHLARHAVAMGYQCMPAGRKA